MYIYTLKYNWSNFVANHKTIKKKKKTTNEYFFYLKIMHSFMFINVVVKKDFGFKKN